MYGVVNVDMMILVVSFMGGWQGAPPPQSCRGAAPERNLSRGRLDPLEYYSTIDTTIGTAIITTTVTANTTARCGFPPQHLSTHTNS